MTVEMTTPDVAGSAAFPALLNLQDLRVQFSSKKGLISAVDGISFEIRAGETLALVGETGSGKSVTGRSLMGLLPSPPAITSSGRALFRVSDEPCLECSGVGCLRCEGTGFSYVDLLSLPESQMQQIRGNRVAMVFQDPGRALNPAYTIDRQLAEAFMRHRADDLLGALDAKDQTWPVRSMATGPTSFGTRQILKLPPWRASRDRLRAAIRDRVADALSETDIANPRQVMRSYPHELSGGMQQRVMIAQALACDPDLLIADEPTTALDVTVQARILDLIAELQDRRGTAVLYISHDLSLVRQISDRVAVMYAGRIAEIGSAAEVFEDAKHPYTIGLLGATPDGTQERGRLRAVPGSVPEVLGIQSQCRFYTRCPHVGAVCRTRNPDPLQISTSTTHFASCYLWDDPVRLGVGEGEMPSRRTL